jgi:hypothetical protein
MNIWVAIFFGAGTAALAYTLLGKRVGYGNTQQVGIIVGVVFLLTTIVFYSLLSMLPGTN